MKEIRIDITEQRPKALTMKMVEEVDVVITMGCGEGVCPVFQNDRRMENRGSQRRNLLQSSEK